EMREYGLRASRNPIVGETSGKDNFRMVASFASSGCRGARVAFSNFPTRRFPEDRKQAGYDLVDHRRPDPRADRAAAAAGSRLTAARLRADAPVDLRAAGLSGLLRGPVRGHRLREDGLREEDRAEVLPCLRLCRPAEVG